MPPASQYTEAIGDEICALLAAGEPLTRICASQDMPSTVTVYKWIGQYEAFANKYMRAREDQADTLADEIVRIADEAPPPDGETGKIDSAWIAWQRNRIDARKWTASKMKPKKYGDKLETKTELSGTLQIEEVRRLIVDPNNE